MSSVTDVLSARHVRIFCQIGCSAVILNFTARSGILPALCQAMTGAGREGLFSPDMLGGAAASCPVVESVEKLTSFSAQIELLIKL
jgi:hypothetical protein